MKKSLVLLLMLVLFMALAVSATACDDGDDDDDDTATDDDDDDDDENTLTNDDDDDNSVNDDDDDGSWDADSLYEEYNCANEDSLDPCALPFCNNLSGYMETRDVVVQEFGEESHYLPQLDDCFDSYISCFDGTCPDLESMDEAGLLACGDSLGECFEGVYGM